MLGISILWNELVNHAFSVKTSVKELRNTTFTLLKMKDLMRKYLSLVCTIIWFMVQSSQVNDSGQWSNKHLYSFLGILFFSEGGPFTGKLYLNVHKNKCVPWWLQMYLLYHTDFVSQLFDSFTVLYLCGKIARKILIFPWRASLLSKLQPFEINQMVISESFIRWL